MAQRKSYFAVAAALTLLLGACVVAPPAAPSQFADRQTDPVVLTGAQVSALAGIPIGEIVGFGYRDGAWKQAPIQIDQRKTVELNTVYNKPANTTNPVNVLVYADPNTFVGAGSGVLGTDDEIAFMAADSGDVAPGGSAPDGVTTTRAQLTITDPRNGHVAYFYLFRRSDPSLVPAPGKNSYVQYDFKLTSGDYKTTYNLADGPNPETSKITTGFYTRDFHDRWLDDGLTITAKNAAKVDILDRHKALFSPGVCGRSEDTFDDAEGAFIANINGPVRAIRSYIGANSGPYTERTQIFYAQREDDITDLRVHAIPSVMDFFDYSDAGRGLTYSNDHNPAGVTVDGQPDSLTAGAPAWEKVDGAQGSLTHVSTIRTNVSPLTVTNFYEDNDTNPSTQCTGDADALGSSGSWITSSIPNTDPHNGAASNLEAVRTMFFESPGRTAADAQLHADQVAQPLTVVAGP
ncbi:MAG TPA: hypothetical protein VL856_10700 [Acidimicrobiia bacterium]|jgi:hypothetical protein|nr:hypothetical protein [Acidimicrobiia bacterium]